MPSLWFIWNRLDMAGLFSILLTGLAFAGLVYFMYKYHLAKMTGKKDISYDFTGLLFLILPTIGGIIGTMGYFLSSRIPDANSRILVSLSVAIFFVVAADLCVRVVVKKKVKEEKQEE